MKKLFTLMLVAGLTLSACVPSVRPFYSDDTLTSDPALVARFADSDPEEIWTFAWDGDKAYDLTIVEHGKTGRFKAHLMKLGEERYLDLVPVEMPSDAPDFYRMHLVPTHTLLRVGAIGEKLELAIMDPQWMEEYLEGHPNALPHSRTHDDRIVLTASTRQLQAFVRKHSGSLFAEPGFLTRANKPDST